MDDDLIVVDDFDNDDDASADPHDTPFYGSRPKASNIGIASGRSFNAGDPSSSKAAANTRLRSSNASASGSGSNARPNNGPSSSTSNDQGAGGTSNSNERTTRSSAMRSSRHSQPKLKLKLGEKAASQAPGMSFLGPYDRELDSDDEDLAFEEQFILRMPPGEDCEKLRKMIQSREVGNDVWFKFKDSRRAVFHIGNNMYSAKLVDLPCVIESQKTLDNKQMFKVADICQMLVVDKKVQSEDQVVKEKGFNIDEFIWPHGLTPPLHHVRKRRFRKRVNRRTIESVEQEVERLLDEDALATEVKYEVLENVNPDLSDSEFIEQDVPLDAPTPAVSDLGDGQTPGDMGEEGYEDNEYEHEHDGEGGGGDGVEGDIDEELAAELDLALENEDDEGDGDDEDDEDDESEEEEESEDEDDEDNQARKLLSEEIRDLEAAVAKKRNEIASSSNPLIRKRFEDALKKLTADLDMKSAQRDDLKERQRLKKEGITMDAVEDTDGDNNPHSMNGHGGAHNGEDDDGDLFGDDSEMDMS